MTYSLLIDIEDDTIVQIHLHLSDHYMLFCHNDEVGFDKREIRTDKYNSDRNYMNYVVDNLDGVQSVISSYKISPKIHRTIKGVEAAFTKLGKEIL